MAANDKKLLDGKTWGERVKVLVISAILASIANTIYTWRLPTFETVLPWQTWPALGLMLAIIFLACLLHDLLAKVIPFDVPIILYIAIITTLLSFEGIAGGLAVFMATEFAKIQLLPLCTPILSYAGISVGRDLDTFKKQGVAIVVVALITFLGTFVGSALIAEITLRLTNVI